MFTYDQVELDEIKIKYFDTSESMKLLMFPKKQRLKYLCLVILMDLFEKTHIYSEKDINEILKPVCEDYVMIRRYLIDYGFLMRQNDGSKYWVK